MPTCCLRSNAVRSFCLFLLLLSPVVPGAPGCSPACAEGARRSLPEAPIVDSRMTMQEALDGLTPNCPKSISRRQKLVSVRYWSFDRKIHQGQLVVDGALEKEVKEAFALAFKERFPIHSVIPIADRRFRKDGRWDDDLSMAANNTSGFNYRPSVGSSHLSKHAYGRAIDVNPVQNPYVKDGVALPPGARHDPRAAGTLAKDHPLVRAFLRQGWTWGGSWTSLKDYQHFEKPLKQ